MIRIKFKKYKDLFLTLKKTIFTIKSKLKELRMMELNLTSTVANILKSWQKESGKI